MELAEFIIDAVPIAKLFPDSARAPPGKQFDRYEAPTGELVYGHADDGDASGVEFNHSMDSGLCQLPKDDDAIFNGVPSLSRDQENAPCPEPFDFAQDMPAEGW